MDNYSANISETSSDNTRDFYIGLCLALTSTIFIGSSFIIKKIALIKLNHIGSLRAGLGGFGYIKEWIWWFGLITMGIGEIANFAAYAFAPATLVTPLGALSVLVSAVWASKYLKEHLNLLGKLGCFLCILGSTVIVIHSPKAEEVESLEELLEKLKKSVFIFYVMFIILMSFSISFYYGPKYGNENVIVYILLCSGIGSLTVMACKGLGIVLKETAAGRHNDLHNWLPYALFVCVVICILIQMNYLNKALDLFNTSIVTPVYYVFFTSFVITASSILFNEWTSLKFEDILGNVCGFLIIIIAIFMLNAFKDIDISLSDVRKFLKPKHELLRNYNQKNNGYKSLFIRDV